MSHKNCYGKILAWGTVMAVAALLSPLATRAQTTATDSTAQETVPFQIPASQPVKTTLVKIVVTNKSTDRLLGDVSIKIKDIGNATTPDPPPQDGYLMQAVPEGEHEFIISRAGYETMDEMYTIEGGKEFQKIEIEMTPLAGTPVVTESTGLSNYNQLASQYLGTLGNWSNYANPNYNAYNQSVLSPFQTSGNYGQPGSSQYVQGQNAYSNYYPQQTGLGTIGQYGQYYSPTADSARTVPTTIYVSGAWGGWSSGADFSSVSVAITDSQTGQAVYNQSFTFGGIANTTSGSGFTCLRAGAPYNITVSRGNTLLTSQNFITSTTGEAASISIDTNSGQISAGVGSLGTLSTTTGNSLRCPDRYYQAATTGGPTGFTDTQFDINNSNYQLKLSSSDNRYYLINLQNQFDYRPVSFVDRGDGGGGLAFFSADTQFRQGYVYSGQTQSGWYVSLYHRGSSGEPQFVGQFSHVNFSPEQYASAIAKQVQNNFAGSIQSVTQSATLTTDQSAASVPAKISLQWTGQNTGETVTVVIREQSSASISYEKTSNSSGALGSTCLKPQTSYTLTFTSSRLPMSGNGLNFTTPSQGQMTNISLTFTESANSGNANMEASPATNDNSVTCPPS